MLSALLVLELLYDLAFDHAGFARYVADLGASNPAHYLRQRPRAPSLRASYTPIASRLYLSHHLGRQSQQPT